MAKKLSTEEILKAARAQSGKGGDDPEKPPTAAASSEQSPSEQTKAEQPAVEQPTETPATSKPAASPQAGPKSTKDILAAARAQTAGGAGAPAAPSGAAPKSTKDILAAARAQTGSTAAAPGAGAKSTKDILAAARAQTDSGGAAAAKPASEKPVVAKAVPAKPVAAAADMPAGNRPSVQEMLKAAREGRPIQEPVPAAAKPAARAVVVPQKPAPAAKKTEDVGEARRGFLAKLGAGLAACGWILFGTWFRTAWTTFTAATGIWSLETARFMMPNVLVEPPSKFKVGPASDYPPAAVSTKWTAQYAVWLVHNEYKGKDIIYALQTVCTHLGCTPNWLEGERKFKCPCHGSGFYITGINFEGPAPRPLERMAIRVSDDGMLEVDKSRKFQEELGQWADPASYVPVA
jgi:cytochrome b6-f complex iron-sulfur subunit